MFRMKEKEIVNACLLINEFLKNKDNWMIVKSKSFVIKIKGIKEPMAAKISHISTVGDSVFLSIAGIRRKFSFRHLRFIPIVMIMNVPVWSIEYIYNPFPCVEEEQEEEDCSEEKSIGYV